MKKVFLMLAVSLLSYGEESHSTKSSAPWLAGTNTNFKHKYSNTEKIGKDYQTYDSDSLTVYVTVFVEVNTTIISSDLRNASPTLKIENFNKGSSFVSDGNYEDMTITFADEIKSTATTNSTDFGGFVEKTPDIGQIDDDLETVEVFDVFIDDYGNIVDNNLSTDISTIEDIVQSAVQEPTPNTIENQSNTSTKISDDEEMLSLVNARRSQDNLPPLQIDQSLMKVAEAQSKYQNSTSTTTHESTYPGLIERFAASGASCSACAENVAGGMSTIRDVVQAWVNSPGHLKNILGPYNRFGWAVVNNYWTQDFNHQ
ncbi:hypothetical protein BB559_004725 [Furculomyces boomerangus]|uniref:SCP domain-containing protein n=2 Tax=Furculomyces boomerangus TaxID=61424 RepID=A0A2T9YD20_9FUNG|nr:hypothetical protein BB559_004725 [Furculomyces boomerangus]